MLKAKRFDFSAGIRSDEFPVDGLVEHARKLAEIQVGRGRCIVAAETRLCFQQSQLQTLDSELRELAQQKTVEVIAKNRFGSYGWE